MSDKPEKFILDATAGFRMMWFDKNQKNTIYLDERPECEPDIVGDFRDLKQFPDETFRLVIFDPPHHIKPLPTEKRRPNRFTKCYGYPLNPETWPSDIKRGLAETFRILKPFGILLFKWTTINIKIESLYPLFPTKPLFAHRLTGSKERGRTQTYWFCFMKSTESIPTPVINNLGINSEHNDCFMKFPSEEG